MNTVASASSSITPSAIINLPKFGAYALKLNPATALNPLSWSLASTSDTLTIAVSPPEGVVVPALTNTATSANFTTLVGGTTYTFTITATKAGETDRVASLTAVWTSNMVLFYTYNLADAKTDVSPNKIANWATGAAVYDMTLATTGTTYLATDFVKRGTASFRGSANYGKVAPFAVDVSAGYTVSYWLYFISQGDGKHFHLQFSDNASSTSNLMVRMNNTVMYLHNSVGGSGNATTTAISANAWTYLTFSCTSNGTLSVYQNAVLVNTFTGYSPISVTTATASLVQIGGYAFPHTPINGRFDDFRFYNKPTTAAQVAALYAVVS